jgi:hypothetical protein
MPKRLRRKHAIGFTNPVTAIFRDYIFCNTTKGFYAEWNFGTGYAQSLQTFYSLT